MDPYFKAAANLQEIAAVSSTTKKQALVAVALQDPFFAKLCEYAYHPFKRYNITVDITKIEPNGNGVIPDEATLWGLLDHLQARQITAANARADVATWHPVVQWLFAGVVNKDLRAGFTDTILNKVRKNFVPSFDCMLAHKYDPKRIKSWPVAVQPKLDGVRCLVRIDGDDVRFMSRTGKEEFAKFPLLEGDLKEFAKTVSGVVWLDGELTSGTFNKTVGDVRRKSAEVDDVYLTVFELLTDAEFTSGKSEYSHKARRQVLVEKVEEWDTLRPVKEWLAYDEMGINCLYDRVRDEGGEGVIVKPLDGHYESKRSYNWLKIKDQQSLDLLCIDVFEGEGKYLGKLGGIIVDNKGVHVRVGSGFSDTQREIIWKQQISVVGQIVEVEFHEVTPDGSLRHPRFKTVRFDKSQPDA